MKKGLILGSLLIFLVAQLLGICSYLRHLGKESVPGLTIEITSTIKPDLLWLTGGLILVFLSWAGLKRGSKEIFYFLIRRQSWKTTAKNLSKSESKSEKLKDLKLVFTVLFGLYFIAFLMNCLGNSIMTMISLLIGGGVIALYLIYQKIYLHNILIIGTIALIGALSKMEIKYAILLIIGFSVFDILAHTKLLKKWSKNPMEKLADFLAKVGFFPCLIIPSKLKNYNLSTIELKEEILKKISGKTEKQEAKKADVGILGPGDLYFPMLVICSTIGGKNLISGLIVLAFSLIGLLTAHLYFIYSKKKMIPGVPFLAAGCILGYLISILII